MLPDSARLEFREMTLADLDDMAALLGDPQVMAYYPAPKTRQEARQWIEWNQRLYTARGFGLWVLTLKPDGVFAGDCGLTPQVIDGVEELEVGYHLLPAMQGRGLAAEAAAAARDFARDVVRSARLVAIIHPDNKPSQRVAEKIGLRPEKRTRGSSGSEVVVYSAGLRGSAMPPQAKA